MRFEAQTITVRNQYDVAHPLPAMAQQGKRDWATDEGLSCLRYRGKHGEIRLPGLLWMFCDAAFAQGFWHGRALLLEREDGEWFVLTDGEFTDLITQELPTTLPAAAIDSWKRGFIFGWCITWYYQPFLNEEAESDEEVQTLAAPAPRKRRKGTHASAPKYPNALRACLKQAGYSFREVSRETAIEAASAPPHRTVRPADDHQSRDPYPAGSGQCGQACRPR